MLPPAVVADANVILSALIGGRARLVIASAYGPRCLAAEAVAAELARHVPRLASKRDLDAASLFAALQVMPIDWQPASAYEELREEAEKRIAAHDQFTSIGREAFAKRAQVELLATGERVRKRSPETRDELTAQQRQIATMAREGLSNPEIGGRLFLSPRTVEWHLGKVFMKLGISSRFELANVLRDLDTALART